MISFSSVSALLFTCREGLHWCSYVMCLSGSHDLTVKAGFCVSALGPVLVEPRLFIPGSHSPPRSSIGMVPAGSLAAPRTRPNGLLAQGPELAVPSPGTLFLSKTAWLLLPPFSP